MPLYYFSIANGERIPPDQGYEFLDDEGARQHALQISRDLSRNRLSGSAWTITVTDQSGRKITEIPTTWVGPD